MCMNPVPHSADSRFTKKEVPVLVEARSLTGPQQERMQVVFPTATKAFNGLGLFSRRHGRVRAVFYKGDGKKCLEIVGEISTPLF